MDPYKFNAIKKYHDFKFNYSFNETELDDWLNELSILDRFATCVKILSALQALNESDLKLEQKLAHLAKIKDFIGDLFKIMEKVFVDSSFPLNNKEKTNLQLLAWINAEIASNYQHIGMATKASRFATKTQVFALNQALMHFGKCMLFIAQAYQLPFSGIWHDCYQIYQFADQHKWLDVEVKQESTNTKTINATFKQLVLFSLCNSNQYRPREMHKIYDILGYFTHFSEITANGWNHPQNECFFSIGQDHEPKNRRLFNTLEDKHLIYHVSSTKVALQLYKDYIKDNKGHGALNIINNALMIRVVKSLGLNQERKLARMQQSKTCKGIVGFENLVNYTRGTSSVDVETGATYDPRIAGQWSTPDFPIVEEGGEWVQQKEYLFKNELKHRNDAQSNKIKKILTTAQGINGDIWQKTLVENEHEKMQPESDDLIGEFQILNNSTKGYGILWRKRSLKVKIGEIFSLLEAPEEAIEVGIIRTIKVTNNDELRLGIEIIGVQSNYVDMIMPNVTKCATSGILLRPEDNSKNIKSLIYANSDFQPGEFVELKEGKGAMTHCQLSRLLHSTAAISHVELNYS